MQTHHAQAVQMAMIVRDRTGDEAVRRLAFDIALSQQQQIGQMAGWLVLWGLPATGAGEPMAWMGGAEDSLARHEMGTGPSASMPGMATAVDLDRLATASGVESEQLFLQLMIAHHRGGVTMAQAALAAADEPAVVGLAERIVAAQLAEIDAMRPMLAERGGTG